VILFSNYSEGIRAIKGAIRPQRAAERARVIGISSTLQGEGKSTRRLAWPVVAAGGHNPSWSTAICAMRLSPSN